MRPLCVSLLIFITSCTSIDSNLYQIESVEGFDLITTRISIDIEKNINGNVSISIQAFPKKADSIKNYKLVFDLKFREDYEGEFTINLNNNNNFKNSIDGKFLEENADGCNTYHYYIRYFELETIDGVSYLIGVATDYAEEYPDAPYIWKQNKNNDLEIIGTSNIEKYSLNFELSK